MPVHPETAAMSPAEWEAFKARIGMRPQVEKAKVFKPFPPFRFVWMASPSGPYPEVWHSSTIGIDSANGKPVEPVPLRVVVISEEEAALPLDALAARYPLDGQAPEAA